MKVERTAAPMTTSSIVEPGQKNRIFSQWLKYIQSFCVSWLLAALPLDATSFSGKTAAIKGYKRTIKKTLRTNFGKHGQASYLLACQEKPVPSTSGLKRNFLRGRSLHGSLLSR
jgi:hypothetical protein